MEGIFLLVIRGALLAYRISHIAQQTTTTTTHTHASSLPTPHRIDTEFTFKEVSTAASVDPSTSDDFLDGPSTTGRRARTRLVSGYDLFLPSHHHYAALGEVGLPVLRAIRGGRQSGVDGVGAPCRLLSQMIKMRRRFSLPICVAFPRYCASSLLCSMRRRNVAELL